MLNLGHAPSLDGIDSADLEMRECADGFVSYNSTVVEDFLELGGCFFALMCGQIGFSAHKNGVPGEPNITTGWHAS